MENHDQQKAEFFHEDDEESRTNDVIDRINNVADLCHSHLSISHLKVRVIPECLLDLTFLQFLYAAQNFLEILPDNFFVCLRSLRWLDLRQNRLVGLPSAGLDTHECLQYLLVEDNRIGQLPTALGLVRSLRGLALTGNPLQFPNWQVVAAGVQSVKRHLRDARELRPETEEPELLAKAERLLPTISQPAGRRSRDRLPANQGRPRGRLSVNPCPSPPGASQSEQAARDAGARGSQEATLQRRRRAEASRQWREESRRQQAARIRDQLLESAMAAHAEAEFRIGDYSSQPQRFRGNQLTPAQEIEVARRNVEDALATQRRLASRRAQLQRHSTTAGTEAPSGRRRGRATKL